VLCSDTESDSHDCTTDVDTSPDLYGARRNEEEQEDKEKEEEKEAGVSEREDIEEEEEETTRTRKAARLCMRLVCLARSCMGCLVIRQVGR
jgi:hypothetical protein